jgi:hypothetical protein
LVKVPPSSRRGSCFINSDEPKFQQPLRSSLETLDRIMKKQLVTLVIHALLPILLSCGFAAAEDTPQLLKVKHSTLSPGSEQVVLQLNGSYSPKIFSLKDENPRVVFDFAAMTQGRDVKNITTTDGSIVKRIRVGAHGDDAPKTRVVFDVATLKGVTYTQHFDEQSSSLVIRFTGPEKAAAPRKQETPAEPAAKKAGKEPEKIPEPATQTEAAASAPAPVPPVDQPVADKPVEPTPPPAPVAEPLVAAKPAPVKPDEKPAAIAKKDKAAPSVDSKKMEQPAPEPAVPAQPETAAASKTEKPAETKAATPPVDPKKDAPPAAETTGKQAQPEAAPLSPATKAEGEQTAAKGKTGAGKTEVPLKTADNPQLESIKFDPSSPKGEMVLFKLNGFHPPAVHGVEEGIPRVICDFNNTKLVDGTKNLIKTDGKFVKAIRTSKTKKPEKVRVVIDLEPNRSYDLQQVFFKEDNLFVLIVNTVKK